jgi:sugar phosphate isomerase/epimerase
MTKIELGINTCFTATRWPRPADKFRIVREELNLDIVQYSLDGFDDKLPGEYKRKLIRSIRDAAARYDVSIHSTLTGASHHHDSLLFHPDPQWRENVLGWFKEAIALSSAIGAKGTGGFFGAMSVPDAASSRKRAALIKRLVGYLATLAGFAGEKGLQFLMVEPMSVRREPPSGLGETLRLLEEANKQAVVPIRLCLDVGHHRAVSASSEAERNPYHWISRLAGFSSCIHLHQTDGLASRHWPFTREYNRRGIIKPEPLLEAIQASAAEAVMLFIEAFHPPFEPRDSRVLEDIKTSVSYWKDALKGSLSCS